jgi:hypothetical protein
MSTKKKTPKRIVVDLCAKKLRKKRLPKTAFKKGGPNPGFKPGQSGSPGSKPKSGERRLLSKALNVFLSDHAPDELGKTLGLPPNPPGSTRFIYSWAQCLAKRVLNLAVKGEPWAVAQVSQLTEPIHSRLMFGGFDGEDEEARPMTTIAFIRSDGNGHVCQDDLCSFPDLAVKTIEGQTTPALPAPED